MRVKTVGGNLTPAEKLNKRQITLGQARNRSKSITIEGVPRSHYIWNFSTNIICNSRTAAVLLHQL